MSISVLALALATVTPAPEAEALGRRLAEAGTLSIVASVMTAKETEEMVADHPELTLPEKQALRATAARQAAADNDRLMSALGHRYAIALSITDLKALVSFSRTEASKHYRDAVPGAVIGAMQAIGTIDFKGETIAAFCKQTRKACGTAGR